MISLYFILFLDMKPKYVHMYFFILKTDTDFKIKINTRN